MKFPIYYVKKSSYSMGETEISYYVYDSDNIFVCKNEFSEANIKDFVDKVNAMYDYIKNTSK